LQDEILSAYDQYHFHVIYQKIHNFCAVDMGSFYLDIIKDRQYTTPVNSLARRSCQTAMYHIIQALTRWLAPILSFTAEEIWHVIPGNTGETVFVEEWYRDWPVVNHVDMNAWAKIHEIRDEVNKALEAKRQAGEIGSGLAANVTLYASEACKPVLDRLKDELRFVLITSGCKVLPLQDCPEGVVVNEMSGIAIEVHASEAIKCERCWHRCDDIGENPEYPGLCRRCTGNITGHDEVRQFA
jgi:isoleucyl-tRNA synthetase